MHKLFRIKRFVTALSLIAVLLSACSSNAKSALPTPTRLPLSVEEQNKADYIDEYYTQLAQEGMFSGSVLVEMDGKIIVDQGYGYADRVNEIPNTIQTRFRIFNASKVFTAIGVMVLVDQGALSVSDPICKYLNDCPSHWGELTVEVLLNGSSGLPDYTLMTPIEKTWDKPISRDDLYALLKGVMMSFQINPDDWGGATDYALLGMIIEDVSGKPYADFMQEYIIKPLGLTNTGFVQRTGEADNLAVFYKGKDIEPAESIDMSNLVGYGGAYSSAEDLFLFVKALRNGELLSAESTAKMLTSNKFGYGYGWQFYTFESKNWITNDVGYTGVTIKHAVLAWTEDGSMETIILTNQQDVNTVVHPQRIACLPDLATTYWFRISSEVLDVCIPSS